MVCRAAQTWAVQLDGHVFADLACLGHEDNDNEVLAVTHAGSVYALHVGGGAVRWRCGLGGQHKLSCAPCAARAVGGGGAWLLLVPSAHGVVTVLEVGAEQEERNGRLAGAGAEARSLEEQGGGAAAGQVVCVVDQVQLPGERPHVFLSLTRRERVELR